MDVVRQKKDPNAPPVNPGLLEKIASTLKPAQSESQIPRKGQRGAILSLGYPARGRFSALGIRLIGDCAASWGQESRLPQALQALDSDVPGYLIFEPVQIYDAKIPNQYPVTWAESGHRASIDLRGLLHPRNLETPENSIAEIALTLEQLPTSGQGRYHLFLHVGNRLIRPEGEVAQEEDDDFTAPDDDVAGASPASQAAPAREK